MPRARFEYNSEAFALLVQDRGLTLAEIASRANISERHLHNIMNQTTLTTRFKTKKKIQDALEGLGVAREDSSNIFRLK
jgi:AraC-like DNA-binding protein